MIILLSIYITNGNYNYVVDLVEYYVNILAQFKDIVEIRLYRKFWRLVELQDEAGRKSSYLFWSR